MSFGWAASLVKATCILAGRRPDANCDTTAARKAAVVSSNDGNLVDFQDLAKEIPICRVCK
jgi:hypothetical protein